MANVNQAISVKEKKLLKAYSSPAE